MDNFTLGYSEVKLLIVKKISTSKIFQIHIDSYLVAITSKPFIRLFTLFQIKKKKSSETINNPLFCTYKQ